MCVCVCVSVCACATLEEIGLVELGGSGSSFLRCLSFIYLLFTCMADASYRGRFRSLLICPLLYLLVPLTPFMCWFCIWPIAAVPLLHIIQKRNYFLIPQRQSTKRFFVTYTKFYCLFGVFLWRLSVKARVCACMCVCVCARAHMYVCLCAVTVENLSFQCASSGTGCWYFQFPASALFSGQQHMRNRYFDWPSACPGSQTYLLWSWVSITFMYWVFECFLHGWDFSGCIPWCQESNFFHKARNMVLSYILSVNAHLAGFKL